MALHIPSAHGCPHVLDQSWSCPLAAWEAAAAAWVWSRIHPDEGWCCSCSLMLPFWLFPTTSVAHSSHLSLPRLALEQERELGLVSSVLAHPQHGSTLALVSGVQEGKNTPRAGGQ